MSEDRRRTGSIAMRVCPVGSRHLPNDPGRWRRAPRPEQRAFFRRPLQARARHDHQPIAQKNPSDEAFIRIRIDPDHQVVTFLDHVDGAVFRRHLQPDLRISERELGRQLAHGGLREQQRRADPQPASRPVATGRNRRCSLVELGEQRPRPLIKRAPFLGQFQRARRRARTGASRGCFPAPRPGATGSPSAARSRARPVRTLRAGRRD